MYSTDRLGSYIRNFRELNRFFLGASAMVTTRSQRAKLDSEDELTDSQANSGTSLGSDPNQHGTRCREHKPPVLASVDGAEYFSADEEVQNVASGGLGTIKEEPLFENPPRRLKVPDLPPLRHPSLLREHVELVEQLYRQDMVNVGFMKAKVAFADSLKKWPDVHEYALELLNTDWVVLKEELIGAFANPSDLRREIEQRLAALSFHEDEMPQFIHKARNIFLMCPPNGDNSAYVAKIMATVPRYILVDLINRIRAIDPAADWKNTDFNAILRHLREAVLTQAAVNEILPTRGSGREHPQRPNMLPSGRRINEMKDSITDRHPKTTWYVRPKTQEAEKLAQLKVEAIEHLELTKKIDRSKFWFFAFKSVPEGERILKQVLQDGEYHPYRARKN